MRRNLGSYLLDMAGDRQNLAYVYADGLRTRSISYAELAHLAWQAGEWMRRQGLTEGDRVVLWAANSGEWAAVFWACLASGIVAVPVDAQSSQEWVNRIVDETGAKFLWQHRELANLRHTVANLPAEPPPGPGPARDALAQIIFTSGSTAAPKGVCLTHGNTLASLEPMEKEIGKYLRWERPFHPVRFLAQLPLSHVFGQMLGLFVPPLLRGEMHFLPELGPAEVIQSIRERRISVLATVPRYLDILGAEVARSSRGRWAERLASSGHGHFLKSWWIFRDVHARLGWKFWAFVCGGASLPEETEVLWRRLGYAVIQGYGMTETASLISVNHPFKMSRGSIGKSMPGRQVRISETGEILVKGETVSPGYWSKEGGAQGWGGEWFSTGDLAESDASGNFFFRGRSKELIVASNGMNIYPEDIEQALRAEPEVSDLVVVGVELPGGPVPMALFRGRANWEAVVQRVNMRLEPHQRVTRWAEWPELDFPRTGTRKVRRGAVRDYAQALVSGEPIESLRASALEQVLRNAGAHWQGTLADDWQLGRHLALDSLARVTLVTALEARFSVSLEEGRITETTTVGTLRQLIVAQMQGDRVSTPAPSSPSEPSAEPPSAIPAPIPTPIPTPSPTEPAFSFPLWPQSWWAAVLRWALHWLLLRPLTAWFSGRAKVTGLENLLGVPGPVLLVANHLTSIDGPLLIGRLPWHRSRKVAIAMSGELLREYQHPSPSLPWFERLALRVQYVLVLLAYNVFPLPRSGGVRRAFQHAGRLADAGYSVLVFPEGRRSETGELLPFQPGTGILARDLRLPVVPVWLQGIRELREQGRRRARAGEVSLRIGPPLEFPATEDAAVATAAVEQAVSRLSRETSTACTLPDPQ
jgi:long-chain acyl-CoA synthetase